MKEQDHTEVKYKGAPVKSTSKEESHAHFNYWEDTRHIGPSYPTARKAFFEACPQSEDPNISSLCERQARDKVHELWRDLLIIYQEVPEYNDWPADVE